MSKVRIACGCGFWLRIFQLRLEEETSVQFVRLVNESRALPIPPPPPRPQHPRDLLTVLPLALFCFIFFFSLRPEI